MIHRLAAVLFGPLLIAQGLWVRKRALRLPEAPGSREGVVGNGPLLRLLILGDSAAAGVGASSQEEALTGQLTSLLSSRNRIEYTLIAKTGATTASTLRRLESMDPRRFDVAVTSLGVNDVVSGVSLRRWRREQAKLRRVLHERFGVKRMLVSGLPPVSEFPLLPQPLRWVLGRQARQFDVALERDLRSEVDAQYLSLIFTNDAGLMAQDGFHPGPEIYRIWAGKAAGLLA